MTTFTPEEMLRYSRHISLPEVGEAGQAKLKAAKVLLIGSGGLGSPNAMYLAAAGVGTIGLVDFDVVDASNLQRQLIFSSEDVGQLKVDAARKRIKAINPNVKVIPHNEKLTSANALAIIKGYDLVIDGSDNFPTRYLVNDACVILSKPNIYGSVLRFEGQASFFLPKEGPCYRCLFPEPPPAGQIPTCAESGVLGILPGLVGLIQASEAIKFLIGKGRLLVGRLLQINVMDMSFREVTVQKDADCAVCGNHPTVKQLIDYDQFCGVRTACEFPRKNDPALPQISAAELKALIDAGQAPAIIDVREPYEHEIARIKGARLIPMGALADHIGALDQDQEYVVHCRSGGRSSRAIKQLQAAGFKNLKNLSGGINAYADVDPTIPKY